MRIRTRIFNYVKKSRSNGEFSEQGILQCQQNQRVSITICTGKFTTLLVINLC